MMICFILNFFTHFRISNTLRIDIRLCIWISIVRGRNRRVCKGLSFVRFSRWVLFIVQKETDKDKLAFRIFRVQFSSVQFLLVVDRTRWNLQRQGSTGISFINLFSLFWLTIVFFWLLFWIILVILEQKMHFHCFCCSNKEKA